jgi:hypothetical protein
MKSNTSKKTRASARLRIGCPYQKLTYHALIGFH